MGHLIADIRYLRQRKPLEAHFPLLIFVVDVSFFFFFVTIRDHQGRNNLSPDQKIDMVNTQRRELVIRSL